MNRHSSGDLVSDRYQIIDYLDEGGMQVVYRAKDLFLNRLVALKTPKMDSAEKRFKRSAVVSSKINHPNVAKTLDYFEFSGRQYLVEEFLTGLNLQKFIFSHLSYLDPYFTAKIFHSLAKGLAASHHVNVIHRDLKPSNIMIDDLSWMNCQIKITDFGIAKMAEKELEEAAEGGESTMSASATAIGALPYMSPEAIERPKDITLSTDIWSIGAIIFEVLTGIKPFSNGLKAVGRIQAGKREAVPSFVNSNPQFSFLANQLLEIVNKCLTLDPLLRPNADELVMLCSNLCYHHSPRHYGRVQSIMYDSYGFINSDSASYFFHLDSVYGEKPNLNDIVYFSFYDSGKAPRALPVLKAK